MNAQPSQPTSSPSAPTEPFESWAVVELMGHRRLAGKVSERAVAGTMLLQVDIPTPTGGMQTQFYGGQAIYCITPTTEEIARSVARHNQPQPIHYYELPAPRATGQEERSAVPFEEYEEPDEAIDYDEYYKDEDEPSPSVTIIVNARQKVVEAEELSYAQIVALAFDGPPSNEERLFTVTYRRGMGNKPQGSLLRGEMLRIQEGMILDVADTSKA